MSQPVIEVEGISKKYQIAHSRAKGRSMGQEIAYNFKRPLETILGRGEKKEDFWALRDISFSLNEGDVLGIIGRNGSGKSTLLKILTRIVDPTEGRAVMRKRVASLLEVGTGFHPELTGRENVFLNGSILGMSQREIKSKFDEIVAFSEVEQFLDTPVKFYSSGMYVRLAFAVAAHLDPEILIIDEVLAVGDAPFQKKCLGRMEDIAKQGRTVLFVSHSMGSVRDLCKQGLFLQKGIGKFYPDVNEALIDYQASTAVKHGKHVKILPKDKDIEFNNIIVNGQPIEQNVHVFSGDSLKISLDYKSDKKRDYDLCVGFSLRNKRDNALVVYTHSHLESVKHKTGKNGHLDAELMIPKLAPDLYGLEVNVWLDDDYVVGDEEVGTIKFEPTPSFESKQMPSSFPSYIMASSTWSFRA